MDCIRFDGLWYADLESYNRATSDLGEEMQDPPVHATLQLSISMEDLLKQMPHGKVDDLERMVAAALQKALNINGKRLVVTGARSNPDRKSVLVFFHILPGAGPAPSTLFDMLRRQLEVQGSAIRTGPIAPYTDGAQLAQIQRKSVTPSPTAGIQRVVSKSEGAWSDHTTIMLVITAVAIIIAVWAVAFAIRAKRTAYRAVERANALAQQYASPPVAAAPAPVPGDGYTIGRPSDDVHGSSASGPADTAYVVGRPIDQSSDSAKNAAADGLALSDIDAEKIAGADFDDQTDATPTRATSSTALLGIAGNINGDGQHAVSRPGTAAGRISEEEEIGWEPPPSKPLKTAVGHNSGESTEIDIDEAEHPYVSGAVTPAIAEETVAAAQGSPTATTCETEQHVGETAASTTPRLDQPVLL
jgi:hypothetical protein